MKCDFVLRNAKIVTQAGILEADCGIANGRIEIVGKILEKGAAERDCSGLFLLPGAIDMHVHFRDPGASAAENFASGSAAAASGGVTTVIDMPNTLPPTITLAALEEKRKIAAEKSLVNFGFYMGFTHGNLDEIAAAKNIAGIKVYLASSTGNLLVKNMENIEALFELGKFVIVHAEDEAHILEHAKKYAGSADPAVHSLIRDNEVALAATKQIFHLAKKYNARVHITHLSTAEEVAELQKFAGPQVSADCTPHHLYLTQAAYAERGNYVKVNPPLRSEEDRQALWKALRDGLIVAVASDHAPHAKADKEKPYADAPAGVPGVETLLPLLLDSVNHGELSLRDVARITSEAPAKLLGIKNKGRIEAGFDADLVLVDMEREMEVGGRRGDGWSSGPHSGYHTKCGWSPFDGWKLKGWPVMTVVRGQIVFENGKIAESNRGREVNFKKPFPE